KDSNEDTVLYAFKKVNESKDLKKDITLHAKEIIKGNILNKGSTKDWSYNDMAP
ncbi:12618_t:CDS:1, partial [Racocetra fulgida]